MRSPRERRAEATRWMAEDDDLLEILGRMDARNRSTLAEVVRSLKHKRSSVYQMLCALDVQRDGMVPRRVVEQVFTRLGVDVPSSELEALLTVFEKRDAEFGTLVDYLDVYHVLTKFSDADAPTARSSPPSQSLSFRTERAGGAVPDQLSYIADTRSRSPQTQLSPRSATTSRNTQGKELSPLRCHLQQIGRGIDSIGERVDRAQYTSPLRSTSPSALPLSPVLKLSHLAPTASSGAGGQDFILRERLQMLEAVGLSLLHHIHCPPLHTDASPHRCDRLL